jgi:predicted RNA-binding protein with PUA-like domain
MLPKPVTLAMLRDSPDVQGMMLLTHSRLSVQPVRPHEWSTVLRLSGLDPAGLLV